MPLLDLQDADRVAPRPFSSFLGAAPELYIKDDRLIELTVARHLGAKAYEELDELEEHGGVDFRWFWQSWAMLMELLKSHQPYALASIAAGLRARLDFERRILAYPERAQRVETLLVEVMRAMPPAGEVYCKEVHVFLTQLSHYLGNQELRLQWRLRRELFTTRAGERLKLHDQTRAIVEKYRGTHVVLSDENNESHKVSLLTQLDAWEVKALLA